MDEIIAPAATTFMRTPNRVAKAIACTIAQLAFRISGTILAAIETMKGRRMHEHLVNMPRAAKDLR